MAASTALPFAWQSRLAGGVSAWTTDALSGAQPAQPCFVHCSLCDPVTRVEGVRTFEGMPGLQLAKLELRCRVCKSRRDDDGAAAAAVVEPEPEPVPDSVAGVYKSGDDAARLQGKIANRKADIAMFSSMGSDGAAMVGVAEQELAQLAARLAVLSAPAVAAAMPEGVPPPTGFVVAPRASVSFAELVDGKSLVGVCHSAACAGTERPAEVVWRCDTCDASSVDGDCSWLPQVRSARPDELCCIMFMEPDPPIDGGRCPAAFVVFDSCGCLADVTSFASQVQAEVDGAGGSKDMIRKDPSNDVWSLCCPMHGKGEPHSSSFIHDIHTFKLVGSALYARIKDWGVDQAVLAQGGVVCPLAGCTSSFFPPPAAHGGGGGAAGAVEGLTCPACQRTFCPECNEPWGSRDCSHSYVPPPEPEPEPPSDKEQLLAAMAEAGFAMCPNCKEGTELAAGCKFVTCRCKAHFCYHCGRLLEEKQHMTHFSDGPYGERCFGGKADQKNHVAAPACPTCPGWTYSKTNCEICKVSCAGNYRGPDAA